MAAGLGAAERPRQLQLQRSTLRPPEVAEELAVGLAGACGQSLRLGAETEVAETMASEAEGAGVAPWGRWR